MFFSNGQSLLEIDASGTEEAPTWYPDVNDLRRELEKAQKERLQATLEGDPATSDRDQATLYKDQATLNRDKAITEKDVEGRAGTDSECARDHGEPRSDEVGTWAIAKAAAAGCGERQTAKGKDANWTLDGSIKTGVEDGARRCTHGERSF